MVAWVALGESRVRRMWRRLGFIISRGRPRWRCTPTSDYRARHARTRREATISSAISSSQRGASARLQTDNGSEFASILLDRWAYGHGVVMDFSRPGKPTDNAFIESFNGSFRDECLNAHWFLSLEDACSKIESWRHDYNHFRPHSSLGDIPSAQFAAQHQTTLPPKSPL